jgi:hypothetical protein
VIFSSCALCFIVRQCPQLALFENESHLLDLEKGFGRLAGRFSVIANYISGKLEKIHPTLSGVIGGCCRWFVGNAMQMVRFIYI